MIFIVLGIVILAISFIVALFSLTREQKEYQVTQNTRNRQQKATANLRPSSNIKVLPPSQVVVKRRFPWEESHQFSGTLHPKEMKGEVAGTGQKQGEISMADLLRRRGS